MIPPTTIEIKSDSNILTFKNTIKPNGKGETLYIYEYEISKTKKGTLLGLTETELTKLINTNS